MTFARGETAFVRLSFHDHAAAKLRRVKVVRQVLFNQPAYRVEDFDDPPNGELWVVDGPKLLPRTQAREWRWRRQKKTS